MKKIKTSVKTIVMIPYYEFDEEKNERYFVGYRHQTHSYETVDGTWWKNESNKPYEIENIPFKITLKYYGFYRGRSAAGLEFVDEKGIPYVVFLKDFEDMITHLVKGSITGTFIYCKRGKSYGVRLVEVD